MVKMANKCQRITKNIGHLADSAIPIAIGIEHGNI